MNLGFHSHISVVIFNTEPIYSKLQVTNFKNKTVMTIKAMEKPDFKEVTANPKLQTLKELIFQKSLTPHPNHNSKPST